MNTDEKNANFKLETDEVSDTYYVTTTEPTDPWNKKRLNEQLDELAEKHGVNRRRLSYKCDIAIVLPICILYLLAFLDRVNISNAQVYGLSKDLGLTDMQYKIALVIFFVPYVVCEIPANYLMKRFKPHVCLSLCCLGFGVLSIGIGFAKNWGALVALRFLLGVVEAGMFPGCAYLLSMWYRREEAQKRFSFFFSSTSLAGAFGGLIAYGMSTLEGKQGLRSWRWLFIVEGAITAVFAIIFFFVIADFPEDAKFLKENERLFMQEKLALDSGEAHAEGKVEMKRLVAVFKDVRLYLSGLMYFGIIVGTYGYAYFAPTIIKSMGTLTNIEVQIKSIWPWVTSFGVSMLSAALSDYFRHRFVFIMILLVMAIAGFSMLIGIDAVVANAPSRYASLFLVCSGYYAVIPLVICWTNMNYSGHYRRMVGPAWQIGFGNIGGFVASFIFPASDSPSYTRGAATCLAMILMTTVCVVVYLVIIWIENKKKHSGQALEEFERLSAEDRKYAGDTNPSFIYQY